MTHPAFDITTPRVTTNNRNPQTPRLHNGLQTVRHHPNQITVVGREKGEADMHRRDSIKRGSSSL